MNIVTNTDKKIVHFIVRIWLLLGYAFVGHGLYRAYSEGYVITKSGRAYLTDDPVMFWLIVSLQIVLILGFTFLFFQKARPRGNGQRLMYQTSIHNTYEPPGCQ